MHIWSPSLFVVSEARRLKVQEGVLSKLHSPCSMHAPMQSRLGALLAGTQRPLPKMGPSRDPPYALSRPHTMCSLIQPLANVSKKTAWQLGRIPRLGGAKHANSGQIVSRLAELFQRLHPTKATTTSNVRSVLKCGRLCKRKITEAQRKTNAAKLFPMIAKKRAARSVPPKGKVSGGRRKIGTRPQPLASNSASQSVGLVGRAVEPTNMHFNAHAASHESRACLRCEFVRRRSTWDSWVEERPSYMGGAWGLGCGPCAWALANKSRRIDGLAKNDVTERSQNGGGKFKRPLASEHRRDARASKWARYEFREFHSASRMVLALRLHRDTMGHRRAVSLMHAHASMNPLLKAAAEKETSALDCPDEAAIGADDEQVLRGRVPQCQDWLDGWVYATSTLSLNKEASMVEKRHGKPDKKLMPGSVVRRGVRKVRRKQTAAMAEVVRRRLRKVLRNARFITLAACNG